MKNNMITAQARTFPLIEDLHVDQSANKGPLFRDRDSQLDIDALTPYVDLARMSKERHDRSPSMQSEVKMARDRNELAARMKRAMNSLCGRYPNATREDVWIELMKKFPSLDYIFRAETSNDR